jgi:hypothetical protein
VGEEMPGWRTELLRSYRLEHRPYILECFFPSSYNMLKALTDHLGGGSRVDSFDPYWQTGGSANFLYIILKGIHHKISITVSIRRRLKTSKITLTGQSHFMLIFVLYTVRSLYQIA